MRIHHLCSICSILIAILFCNCYYSVAKYLNSFNLSGINAGSFIPKTVDSIPVPQARVSGCLQYSCVSRVGYNNGQHSPVDTTGIFDPNKIYCQSAGLCSLNYKEYNIKWNTPHLFSSFSADFGPFAKFVSVSTQTDISIINNNIFFNLKVGPAVQFVKSRSGIRCDFIFSAGNFFYSAEKIMYNGSYYSLNRDTVDEPLTVFGFSPCISINTLREYLNLRYFVQGGYQLYTPFFKQDGLSVKFSYALLSAGIFKNFSFYTMMAGIRLAYETKCDILTESEPEFDKLNRTDTPVIPTVFLNLTFNFKFR